MTALHTVDIKWLLGLAAEPHRKGWSGAQLALAAAERRSEFRCIPSALFRLRPALTALDLSHCKALTALPASIGELQALASLRLINCKALTALPHAMSRLHRLGELNVMSCKALCEMPDLSHLPPNQLRPWPPGLFKPGPRGHLHGWEAGGRKAWVLETDDADEDSEGRPLTPPPAAGSAGPGP